MRFSHAVSITHVTTIYITNSSNHFISRFFLLGCSHVVCLLTRSPCNGYGETDTTGVQPLVGTLLGGMRPCVVRTKPVSMPIA